MKSNLPVILLLVACVSLGIVSWKQNQRYADQTQHLDQTINFYSNRVTILQVELAHEAAENAALSNHLGVVETTLSTTSARLQKAEAEGKAAAAAISDKVEAIRILENWKIEAQRIMEVRKLDSDEDSKEQRDMLFNVMAQLAQLSRSQK